MVEELEELNEPLRNRDKMEDDAIAQLSDQLVALIISLAGIYCNNRAFCLTIYTYDT